MSCSPTGYKACLVCCNVALLFVGTAILILGFKMKWAIDSLLLTIPSIAKAFKAVISTGLLISVAGITGICGTCYEVLWLISVHLFFLAVIVIMEFALGVTLIVIRTTIENYIESPECGYSCTMTLDAVVFDYALPSCGLMMTIIIVEALMIFCAIQLYFHIRESLKVEGMLPRADRNLQMLDVSDLYPSFPHSPRHGHSPRLSNDRLNHSMYSPQLSPYPTPMFSPKPPDYSDQQPPSYFDVVPSACRSPARDRSRSPTYNPA